MNRWNRVSEWMEQKESDEVSVVGGVKLGHVKILCIIMSF